MKERKFLEEIAGLLLLFMTVYVVLALVSYTPDDISFNFSSSNNPVVNKAGFIGAWLSFAFFFAFGFAAYAFPFILIVLSFYLFRSVSRRQFLFKILWGLGLLIVLSLGFSVFRFQALEASKSGLNIISQGGVIGHVLGGEKLSDYIGYGGSILLLGIFFLVFFLLLTEISLVRTGRFFWTVLKQALHGINVMSLFLNRGWKRFVERFSARQEVGEQEKYEVKRKAKRSFVPPAPELPVKEKSTVKKIKDALKTKKTAQSPGEKKPKKDIVRPARDISMPPLSLLADYKEKRSSHGADNEMFEQSANTLESTLAEFGLDVNVINVQKGPAVTRFEMSIAPGTKVEKIISLSNNIALAMKAMSVRIIAPIPGKSAVGIEIPNVKTEVVSLREMLESRVYQEEEYAIPLALGKDISGQPVVVDLADMPHLLIAGATGSGKSVCINAIINTLLFSATPEEIRFVLIDPKKVELSCYNGIPHLYCPIINTSHKASLGLRLLIKEMERRYEMFAKLGVRNISVYHKLRQKMMKKPGEDEQEEIPENLPFIVTVIDEMADLILVSSSDVQDSIIRLAQLSRAVGMHLILATQRPSVKVVTGLIKANIPSRISFKLPSKIDSRTVLDANGADKLLGDGDMLFLPPGTSQLLRAQGTYVSDAEIKRVVHFWKEELPLNYNDDITKKLSSASSTPDEDTDKLFEEAVRIVLEGSIASASLLQRRLKIGYNRASRIIDVMEDRGIIGPHVGSKGRDIYIESWEDYENLDG